MSGLFSAALVIGGALVLAAAVGGGAAVWTASINAEAAEEVASQQAMATIKAAEEAAEAQKASAESNRLAMDHDSDNRLKQEEMFLEQERWFETQQQDGNSFYAQMTRELDTMDTFYADDASWGGESEASYDYGHDA